MDPDLDALVGEWLTIPDLADALGTDAGRARRLVGDRKLVAVPRGEREILSVPARFVVAGPDGRAEPVPALHGTLVVLGDAGLSDAEAIRWLFTPDPSLESLGPDRPRTPIDALVAGHKTEIRRRAQAEAL